MSYGDYHSHTADEVGAAHADHRHGAYDVGAAEDNHTHYPHEVGASPQSHEHPLSHIAGAASESDVDDLRSEARQQCDRLTSAENAIRALQEQNTTLWAQLQAEMAANAALRAGAVTLPLLIKALRYEAQIAQNYDYGQALFALAATIQREAR